MMYTWVIFTLVSSLSRVRSDDVLQPCASIRTSASVVPLGSPVNATCVVGGRCPRAAAPDVHLDWYLGSQLLAGRPSARSESGAAASELLIPSFDRTRAFLTCCVRASPAQVVGGVEIRAGYPPEPPQNLSCRTNLTTPNTLTCRWDPGPRETHLPTQYTLHTNIWDSRENFTYKLAPAVHHYTVPRSGFVLFSEMEIYVKAANELGEATSEPLVLEPVSAAKFDPPKILRVEAVPKRFGCLRLIWGLSQHQAWMSDYRLNLEVRFKAAGGGQWSERPILVGRVRPTRAVDQCRLRHGTPYWVQIRVGYQQSPWSEWSGSRSGVTPECAPTGRLDWWMKLSGDHTHKQLHVHLFWKASKQFRGNSQNVTYVVRGQKLPGEKGKVCSTAGNHCAFALSRKVKRVYLVAVNAVGKSSPTEVRIYQPKGTQSAISDLTAVPRDDATILVRWQSAAVSAPVGYVVEWRPLLNANEDLSLAAFEFAARNQSSLVIPGSLEPYKPYGISVYPRFKDGIGLPRTVDAYSRQKAPSMVPKVQIKTWQSHVELSWDEVPLNQRNGIIQSYKIFYWNEKGPVKVANADVAARRVVLKNLNPVALYEAFVMVSTSGGSLNGSTIHFKIEPFDSVAIVMIVTASGVGLSVLIILTVMTCVSNQNRLKGRFWPTVPDPANSSVKRWKTETLQYTRSSWDSDEPNPIYLSHLSFLDLPKKLGRQEDDLWSSGAEDTSDLGESICGSPFTPGYSGSNSDSVPYATVIFSGPCVGPAATEPRAYLRSESTQPLLEAEEGVTPQCYQNVANDDGRPGEQRFFGPGRDRAVPEEEEGPAVIWDDFPFLRALAMSDAQDD